MRRSLLLGLVSLATLTAFAPEAGAAPTRWARNGHLYEVLFVRVGVTWPEARRLARRRGCGWDLVTITSAAENDFVFGLARRKVPAVFDAEGGSGPWLGGVQPTGSPEPAGGWRWVTAEPFRYTNWNPGEPNDSGGEKHMNSYRSGTWNDAKATDRLQGYIAERHRRC